MSKKLEFSLYLQPNEIDGQLDYEVIGARFDREDGDYEIYKGWHDSSGTTKLVVRLNKRAGNQSYLLIHKLTVNGIDLHHIENWSSYISSDTGKSLPLTHGWMSAPGDYILKIRQNPIVFNYLNHFYDTCKQRN